MSNENREYKDEQRAKIKKALKEVVELLKQLESEQEQEQEPVKAPPDMTLVYVWNIEYKNRSLRYSTGEVNDSGELLCYAGVTTKDNDIVAYRPWPHWEIHPEANRHLYFFDHDGSAKRPVDPEQKVYLKYKYGDCLFLHSNPNNTTWKDVEKYAYYHEVD